MFNGQQPMNTEQELTQAQQNAAIAQISVGELKLLYDRLSFLESLHDETTVKSEELATRLRMLEIHITNAPPIPAATTPRATEPKLPDPEPFTGDRLKLLDFLTKCRLKFLGQPITYALETSKVIYTGTLLREEAFSWFQPYFVRATTTNDWPEEIANFEALAQSLTTLYGDPNLEISSEEALTALKQTADVPSYIAQFERLAQYVKWNDPAKLARFYEGLRGNVKDDLAHHERPTTLAELKIAAVRADVRIRRRLQEKARANLNYNSDRKPANLSPTSHFPSRSSSLRSIPPIPSRTPSPGTPSSANQNPSISGIPQFTADGTVPMSLNQTGPFPRTLRDPLTLDERQRRDDLNLCRYCADPGHRVANCPVTPKRSRYPTRTVSET